MELRRTLNGALAGAAAAAAWAAQQPLDKRVFGSRYDDVELLGKLVTRGPAWPAVRERPSCRPVRVAADRCFASICPLPPYEPNG